MNVDVENYIRQNYIWSKLPSNVKQVLGNSQKEYEKLVVHYSIKNQLRYRGNVVRHIKKDERAYYEALLRYSREHLMLYPYHLSDFIVTGMRITPFQYYICIMQDLLEQERSYDSLPNFTAADCLRLLGIGRNQYIDLMNQCRSSKKFFGVIRRSIRELLPSTPLASVNLEPWWMVQVGYVTEDDIRVVLPSEKSIIDSLIDDGRQRAGDFNMKDIKGLYVKGLIYADVPIEDDDCIAVPPLEGFVMNRVLGDYFETLLYKIFVSIDEHTTVSELASVLQIDLQLVKNAVSMYCRLGFAHKKGKDTDCSQHHPSWNAAPLTVPCKSSCAEVEQFLNALNSEVEKEGTPFDGSTLSADSASSDDQVPAVLSSVSHSKRIGFLFDSTLTAFLMMGNLSPGLKSHAVTMFEVGKLSDESLDSFLVELEKVADIGEGEAQRYFDHALTLRDTIQFLRHNSSMASSFPIIQSDTGSGPGLDLIRCESLQNLDLQTCKRLLNKNYALLVSMAPLSNEIRPVTSCIPPHLGPAIPEVSSVWFKLFIYTIARSGPPSLLLVKGTRLRILPRVFQDHEKLLVTTWGHDPGTVQMSSALTTLNDALSHSAVLIQAQGGGGEFVYVPFPFHKDGCNASGASLRRFECHSAIQALSKNVDLRHCSGYITLMRMSKNRAGASSLPASPGLPTSLCHEPTDSLVNSFHRVVLDRSNGSPVNGVTGEDAQCLLTTELESLENAVSKEDQTSFKISKNKVVENLELKLETDVVPSDCESADEWDIRESEWTLLDCCFGVPLFDGKLNRQVCQRIMQYDLCSQSSLTNMTQSSRNLCIRLLDFILEQQVVTASSDARNAIFLPNRPGCDQDLPLPTRNLLFNDGQLSVWDGR